MLDEGGFDMLMLYEPFARHNTDTFSPTLSRLRFLRYNKRFTTVDRQSATSPTLLPPATMLSNLGCSACVNGLVCSVLAVD